MAFPLKCLGLFLSFLLLGIPSNGQVALNDDLCPRLSPVLCVRDVLLAIASTTKSLNRTLNQIDDEIEEKVQIIDTLNRYVQFELSLIHFRLPTPQFHMQFIQMNNVDQVKKLPLFSPIDEDILRLEIRQSTVPGGALRDELLFEHDQRHFEPSKSVRGGHGQLASASSRVDSARSDLSVSKYFTCLRLFLATYRRHGAHRIFQTQVSRHLVAHARRSIDFNCSIGSRMDATNSRRDDQSRVEIDLTEILRFTPLHLGLTNIKNPLNIVPQSARNETKYFVLHNN